MFRGDARRDLRCGRTYNALREDVAGQRVGFDRSIETGVCERYQGIYKGEGFPTRTRPLLYQSSCLRCGQFEERAGEKEPMVVLGDATQKSTRR
jgi:hypothetical protein